MEVDNASGLVYNVRGERVDRTEPLCLGVPFCTLQMVEKKTPVRYHGRVGKARSGKPFLPSLDSILH